MRIALVVSQADDTKDRWDVTILTQYEHEGSDGMVAVEAISDLRKVYPGEEIALIVYEDGEVRTTRVQPLEDTTVVPIQ